MIDFKINPIKTSKGTSNGIKFNINNKSKYLRICILLIFLNMTGIFFWWYLFDQINFEKDKFFGIKYEIEEIHFKTNNINYTEKWLNRTKDDWKIVDSMFINEKDLVLFIKELEKIADMSQIDLDVTRASVPIDSTLNPNFVVNIKGEFNSIHRYIALLYNVPYQVLFDKVAIQKDNIGEDDSLWKARLEFQVLSYKPLDQD